MPFDLGRSDDGTWLDYPGGEGEQYCIRPLTPDKLRHFAKLTTRNVRNRTGQEEQRVDEERQRELWFDYLIEAWTGITINGQPAECTLENKLKLAGLSGKRANWLVDMAIDLANDEAQKGKAEEEAFRGVGEAGDRRAMAELSRVPHPQ